MAVKLGGERLANLYVWLKFFHVLGVGMFLFGHGVSAVASFAVRGRPADAGTGALLRASIRSGAITYPGLLLLIVTGVWMGFAGSLWHTGWIWAAIVVLVLATVVMGPLSRPYHMARDMVAKNEAGADAELQKARPVPIAVAGTVAIVLLIFLMVVKPF